MSRLESHMAALNISGWKFTVKEASGLFARRKLTGDEHMYIQKKTKISDFWTTTRADVFNFFSIKRAG
jgi:hypothetical protein